jgi:hypothetical protein
MAQVEINAIRKANGDVYVKVDDLIKSMYNDFAELGNDEAAVKNYIKFTIENWEDYQKKIRDKDL